MSEQKNRLTDVLPEIIRKLSIGFSVSLAPGGSSMQPMLYGNRDSVVLSPVRNKIRKGDILFFRYENRIILHRVIRIENSKYWCQGDHLCKIEGPVNEDQVIAVVTAFTHKGRHYETSDRLYRIYWHLLPVIRPVFLFLQKAKHRIQHKRVSRK